MDSREWATTLAKLFFGSCVYRAGCFVLPVMLMAACANAQNTASDPDGVASATARSFWNDQNYLLGDWGGERSRLEAKGVSFSFYYVSDFLGNPSGGNNQAFTDWGRIRGTVDIDIGKLTDTNAPTFHIRRLWQNGGNLGAEHLGSLANPSSLVSEPTFRRDSWWFQQALFNRHLFIKGGQLAGLDFYRVQEYGGSYLLEPLWLRSRQSVHHDLRIF